MLVPGIISFSIFSDMVKEKYDDFAVNTNISEEFKTVAENCNETNKEANGTNLISSVTGEMQLNLDEAEGDTLMPGKGKLSSGGSAGGCGSGCGSGCGNMVRSGGCGGCGAGGQCGSIVKSGGCGGCGGSGGCSGSCGNMVVSGGCGGCGGGGGCGNLISSGGCGGCGSSGCGGCGARFAQSENSC